MHLTTMSNYRHFKHFFDPVDWLDSKWKDKINTGFLSVNDAANLSGFTRQYVYNKIKLGALVSMQKQGKTLIPWRKFVLWYSSKSITPDSPIGAPSYSINGMEDLTSKKRCWVFRFVAKHGITSYYVGRHRRFNKHEVDQAWATESIYFKEWITIEEISIAFNIETDDVLYASARHRINRKIVDGEVLYLRKDIEYFKMRKEVLL